ncbi:GlxA family transcriptional regulator [Pseudorhodoplanes sinuspersici]
MRERQNGQDRVIRASPAMFNRPVRVSLVVFPECDPSIVFGVFDTLWAAGRLSSLFNNALPDVSLFEPRLVGAKAGPLQLVTGVSIVVQDAVSGVADTDIVFVPNIMVRTNADLRALDRDLLAWIKAMHDKGTHIYASCGGSLVLAEAGLLKGHQATTHWCYVPLFRDQFPDIDLQPDRILVRSGEGQRIVCSGGASAWQDLALMMIAKRAGTDEAIRMSKLFLYQWHRDGQLPYSSMRQNVEHGDAAVLKCQTWLAQHYDHDDVVAELIRHSGLPRRTFARRFRAATGYSPLEYVQALRIEEAKQILETTTIAVEDVAREVGYDDVASFRRLFRRLAGMSPGEYRRKFQLPLIDDGAGTGRGRTQ